MAMTERSTTPRADPIPSVDRVSSTVSAPRTSVPILSARSPITTLTATSVTPSAASPNVAHKGLSPRSSPRPLTGAAALADARRARQSKELREDRQTSPNPSVLAINALMGTQETSKPSDAPATTQMSEPMRKVADKITVPLTNGQHAHQPATDGTPSPSRSQATRPSSAVTATASPSHHGRDLVEEPESMEDNGESEERIHGGARPFTYPGPMPNSALETPPGRDLSYDSAANKSAKRHKCPYCSTDFTRHHNLKSHLLTHSQEKPYVCQTCQARFRRLHDLKRHTKLHTGERPHTCPKCGRKFARGDALARHNKGPGGCANRKSSFGADDEDGGDDTMEVDYDNDQGDDRADDSEMMDSQGRRVSEPNRKRPHPDSTPESVQSHYRQHSSTYPPPVGRSVRSDMAPMGPPSTVLSPSSKPSPQDHPPGPPVPTEPHFQSQYYPQPPPGSSYPPPQVTESPRPLSPRGSDHHRLSLSDPSSLRNRSPSVTSNYQSPYGRGSGPPAHMGSHGPQLPSLPSLAAATHHTVQPPLPAPSYASHHASQTHQPAGGTISSNPGSSSSHGHSSGSSMRDIVGHDTQDLMAYVRSLEQRMSRMSDEYELRLGRLQQEVIDLKNQVYAAR